MQAEERGDVPQPLDEPDPDDEPDDDELDDLTDADVQALVQAELEHIRKLTEPT